MKWQKSPPELAEAFDRALPDDPRVERRAMFGYPCSFVNGQMYAGLHQENLVVRLPAEQREELLRIPGAEPFVPMPGRAMKEYVVVPRSVIGRPRELSAWLERAFAYAAALPPKEPRRKAGKRRG